jgi:WD40 repeat protein
MSSPTSPTSFSPDDPERTVAVERTAPGAADPEHSSTLTQPDGAPAPEAERPAVPGYQILEVLGRGGMGVVYKARQVGLNRLVALKMVLAGAHAAPQDLVRFLAEAEVVARLQHTNVVQIYQIGRQGDVPFFSLEYVDGGTLAQRLAGAPQQPRDAARLVECLARAVYLAHQKGIVHRDLKPSNILLALPAAPPDGDAPAPADPAALSACTPKITDFGLAKRVETGCGLTQTGAILGTPSYMAPEQAEAKKDVGPAVDIYSLGAILYEMLTGRPPFRAPTPLDTLMHVLSDEPVPPGRLQPGCPRDLETVCLKCLHKDPSRRYATAEALADDLQRFLTDRPVLARRTGAAERLRRWCRRNPLIAGMTAALALLLVVLAVGASVAALLLREERNDAVDSRDRAEKAERLRTEQLATSYLEQARARRYSRQAGQHFQSLEALAEAARIVRRMDLDAAARDERLQELRTEAVACLALADVRRERRLEDVFIENHGTGFQKAVVFTPSWDEYARAEDGGPISVRRLDGDREIARLPGGGPTAYILAFSPDGRYLAGKYYRREQPIEYVVWDWRDGRAAVRQPCAGDTSPTVDFAFTPDGRHVLLRCRADGSLGAFDLATGNEAYRLETGAPGPWAIAPAADGRRLATAHGHGTAHGGEVTIRDARTGAPLGPSWRTPGDVWSLTWHAGSDLVAAGAGSQIYLWDAATGQARGVLEGHEATVVKLAFNPAGTLLASYSWDLTMRLWDPASGKELLQVNGDPLEFSADGRRLAYVAGRELGVWQVADGGVCRLLAHPSGVVRSELHPDGSLLVSATSAGSFLWDAPGGKQLAQLDRSPTPVALFLPSGDIVTTPSGQGVNRWPLRRTEPGAARVGPPTRLPFPPPGNLNSAALDAGGHKLAVVEFRRQANVVDLDGAAQPLVFTGHASVGSVALSPDGRWMATSTFKGLDVKVWDLAAREPNRAAASFRAAERAVAGFSRDGRWLVVDEPLKNVRQFYRVGSWELEREEDVTAVNGIASTPGGLMAAASQGGRQVRLFDPATGRTWATLPAVQGQRVGPLSLSDDGSRLAAAGGRFVQLWDLRALRAALAAVGLDWPADPYPPPAGSPKGPFAVTVKRLPGEDPPPADGPGVVIVRSLPRPRPATADEIAGWVRQLDDADEKVRGAAADALTAVGAPAVATLKAAAGGPDGGPAKQARAVLDRIAVAEVLAPTRLNLKLEDALPADAVTALAERSGLPLQYMPPPGGKPPKRVTLDLDDVTAWEALDRLCEAAGLGYSYTALPASVVRLSHQAPRPLAGADVGPFRLLPTGGMYQRSLTFLGDAPRPNEFLQLNLAVLREPHVRVLSYEAPPRLTEARGADGQSYLPAVPPARYRPATDGAYISLLCPLKPPERRGERLKVLKGVLSVEIAARPQELATVPDLAKTPGKTFRGAEGHRLTVTAARPGGGQWEVQLRVIGPPGWRYDPKVHAVELIDARGRTSRSSYGTLSPSPVRGLQQEDLAWLAADPGAPGVAAVPWPAVALQRARPQWTEWSGGLYFVAPQFEGPVRLRLYRFDRLQAELPFELRDVPLP